MADEGGVLRRFVRRRSDGCDVGAGPGLRSVSGSLTAFGSELVQQDDGAIVLDLGRLDESVDEEVDLRALRPGAEGELLRLRPEQRRPLEHEPLEADAVAAARPQPDPVREPGSAPAAAPVVSGASAAISEKAKTPVCSSRRFVSPSARAS